MTPDFYALQLFVKLLIGHAFADFAWQPPLMAKAKNPRWCPDPADVPVGQMIMPTWFFWLTAHALIHAAMVWAFTQSPLLGLCEFVVHWLTDLAKCYGLTNPVTDQSIHIFSKVMWVLIRQVFYTPPYVSFF